VHRLRRRRELDARAHAGVDPRAHHQRLGRQELLHLEAALREQHAQRGGRKLLGLLAALDELDLVGRDELGRARRQLLQRQHLLRAAQFACGWVGVRVRGVVGSRHWRTASRCW
jgi:hypothetical protein